MDQKWTSKCYWFRGIFISSYKYITYLINFEIFKFSDRRDTGYLLSPTHEEEITSLVASTVKSYKELPVRLYQICTSVLAILSIYSPVLFQLGNTGTN